MSDLTRTTINLSPRAVAARDRLVEITGDTQTDIINAALRLYAVIADLAQDGRLTVVLPDGTRVEVIIP